VRGMGEELFARGFVCRVKSSYIYQGAIK